MVSSEGNKEHGHDSSEDIDKEYEVQGENNLTRKDLLDQLEAQCRFYEKLPDHEKWSPCCNVDLAYFMLLVLNILKRSQ